MSGNHRSGRKPKPIEWIREGDCIILTSHAHWSNGYPTLMRDGRKTSAGRIVLERKLGRKLPEGLMSRHTCDNRSCINPNHLLVGTHSDNMRDMVERGRSARGENQNSVKLTATQVQMIRADCRQQVEIANTYGIDQSDVSLIKNRKIWKHIK